MLNIDKAQEQYSQLSGFLADITLLANTADEEDEKELEVMRQLATRLSNKWRAFIAEACYRERAGNGAQKPQAEASE